MRNYLDDIQDHRDKAGTSAASPRRKKAHLTRVRGSAELTPAQLRSRKRIGKGARHTNAEEAPVVRKKRISTKARRAALRNLKKARAARRGGKRRRKNPVAAGEARRRSSKRKSAKRVRAGKKAARTRKRRKAARRTTKRRSSKRRSKRRSGHRVSPKRRRAALKGARTRKRRSESRYDSGWRGGDPDSYGETRKRPRKRRRKASKRRRKNPISAAAEAPRRRRRKRRKNPVSAAESPRRRKPRRRKGRGLHYTGKPRTRRRRANDARRGVDRRKRRRIRRNPVAKEARRRRHHRRSSHRRRRNPLPNPISGVMEFVGGVLGVGTGFGIASLVDRILVTHALTTAATSGQGGGTDAPAVGQIYNSEALLTPIWSSWQRMAGAVGAIAAPLVAARFVTVHTGLKTFFQLAGFGALGRTAGKAMDDAVASMLSTNVTAQRLYAGEIAAKAKMTAAATTALPAIAPGTFAGLPRRHMNPGVVRAFAGAPVGSFAALPTMAGPTAAGIGNMPQTQAQMSQPRGGQVPGVYAQNPPDANMSPNATTPFNSLMFNPDGQE